MAAVAVVAGSLDSTSWERKAGRKVCTAAAIGRPPTHGGSLLQMTSDATTGCTFRTTLQARIVIPLTIFLFFSPIRNVKTIKKLYADKNRSPIQVSSNDAFRFYTLERIFASSACITSYRRIAVAIISELGVPREAYRDREGQRKVARRGSMTHSRRPRR